jgi:MarR family transcriptional regulator for hemolysin
MIEGPENVVDLATRFESALYAIARSWRHTVDRRLKYLGFDVASWMTIAAVAQVRSPLSQSELADTVAVSDASMVRVIDRLVKARLVIREPSISDRRVNRVVITDAGHRLYAELQKEVAAMFQQLLACIEFEKLAHLTDLLEQLQPVLQPYHEPENSSPQLALGGGAKDDVASPVMAYCSHPPPRAL